MTATPHVLARILEQTRADVAQRKARAPIDQLRARADALDPPRDLLHALRQGQARRPVSVIAEVKRKSPSAGWIRESYRTDPFDAAGVAEAYHRAGAAAISCLTDEPFFAGSLGFIDAIRARIPLPVLRKDFIVDPWQVWESRAAGADAVLLIAECLDDRALDELAPLARTLGLSVLLEIHDAEHLDRALRHVRHDPPVCLLGINSRDLRTMTVDTDRALALAAAAPRPDLVVCESGIREPADLERLARAGVGVALVGEHLMRDADPGAALARLLAR